LVQRGILYTVIGLNHNGEASVIVALSSSIMNDISAIIMVTSWMSFWFSSTILILSFVEFDVRDASYLTSSATMVKTLLYSPARAASITALIAHQFILSGGRWNLGNHALSAFRSVIEGVLF